MPLRTAAMALATDFRVFVRHLVIVELYDDPSTLRYIMERAGRDHITVPSQDIVDHRFERVPRRQVRSIRFGGQATSLRQLVKLAGQDVEVMLMSGNTMRGRLGVPTAEFIALGGGQIRLEDIFDARPA